MRLCDHPNDRILIARISGAAGRRAAKLARGECQLHEAVAELHALSTDPHLLAHGGHARNTHGHRDVRALLEAAGADPAAMDAIEQAITPQATRYT